VDTERITGPDAETGIACTLGTEGAATQGERWLRLGREAGLGRTQTADGLEIRFRGEPAVERELRALVAVESGCCGWARWEVRPAGGELVMRVSSTPEGAAALHTMFAARPAGDSGPR
jgi:hypothetical protein